jgi:uncharacterized membrane protein
MTLFGALEIPVRLPAQEHLRYKLIDLGTLGGPQSFGVNTNNRGMAVGFADTTTPDPNYPNFNPGFVQDPFIYHAFEWNNGALVDLEALPGKNSSSGGVSASGLVAGQSLIGTINPLTGWPEGNAVFWKDGQIINLGTLGGHESAAGQVNSRGQVTGYAQNAIPDPLSIVYFLFLRLSNGTQTRAFLWDESKGMQDIGTLGGPDAFAPYINERGLYELHTEFYNGCTHARPVPVGKRQND